MVEFIGDYVEFDDHSDYLIISISSTKSSIQEQLRNNRLSSNFLGDYWVTILSKPENIIKENDENTKHTIHFIANELLDNAVKFNYEINKNPIKLNLYLYDNIFRIYVTNSINPNHINKFKEFIKTLLSKDTQELYVQQVESNVHQKDNSISKLGFLTMINDYDVKFAWKFYREPKNSSVFVTIMAEMPPISRI